jgi:glycosyltransferase involved in cell wall biosynthesis
MGGFPSSINLAIIGELRQQHYDAVLVYGYTSINEWVTFLAAWLTKTPLFLRGDSTLSTPRPLAVRVAKHIVLRPLLHSIQICLYVGKRNRRFYEHYGVRSERLILSPHSVDNDFFSKGTSVAEDEQDSFRHRHGIPTDVPLIMFAGKLISKKQPLHLLQAFERVRTRHKCALVFAGEGELRQVIERACIERSIPDVYITGFLNQTEMPAAYAAADILVLPSAWYETWGLVVNEGMSCSLPIIVTDRVGCADDLVYDDENGYVVPWNDVDALTEALEKLVVDPDRRQRFGRCSVEIIKDYSLAQTVDGIVQACLRTGCR